MFIAHGNIPTLLDQPDPLRLRIPVARENFAVQGKGIVDGRPCVVLKSSKPLDNGDTFVEYWVDPSKESAVVRWLGYCNGKPLVQVDMQYARAEFGWALSKWTHTQYHPDGRPGVDSYETLNVLTFQPNERFGMEVFQQTPSPGMKVIFEEKKGVYQMNADGSFRKIDPPRRGNRRTLNIITSLIGAATVFGLMVGCVYLIKRNRRKNAST